jgi:hypothetical protein
MRLWNSLVILFCALMYPLGVSADESALPKIGVLVPAFEGKKPIGENISTLLSLHLWRTLRRAESEASVDYKLDSAKINLGKRSLAGLSDEFARQEARVTNSQLALWGTVEQYGSTAFVQTALSIENREELLEKNTAAIWSIDRRGVSLKLGLPTNVVLFSPLTLNEATAARYSQIDAVKICASKEAECEGTALNREQFVPLREEGEWVYGQQPSVDATIEGWVHLPELGGAQIEITRFTGGLVAYLRGDYKLANNLLSVESGNALVRYYALLFQGLATARSGELDSKSLEAAHRVNPYSRFPIRASFMAYAMAASKSDDVEIRYSLAKQADGILSMHKGQFDLDDGWYESAVAYSKGLFEQ